MSQLTPKIIRILALIEAEPRYGKQLRDLEPACFATPARQDPGPSEVYRTMGALEKRGLVKRLHNYQPPKRKRGPHHQTTSRAVWYGLTEQGAAQLAEARAIIGGATEAPEPEPEEVPRGRPQQRRSTWNAE